MADESPHFTLSTHESIVIDGANSVGGAPRQHFPDAALSLALGAVVFLASLIVLRTKRFRPALLAALLFASVPGGIAVFALRADAPVQRRGLAEAVTSSLADVQRVAPWPQQPAQVVLDDGDVLFPLGRYAWPNRPDAGVEVELRGSVLRSNCARDEASGHVVCGARP
ncbi:MAG: hypothetical protein Q8S33_33490 [Myxococcales bacterium]|nr:hypothetical protein [Myxococcales bacterium]